MTPFIVIAALLTLGAVALLVIPLVWKKGAVKPAIWTALVCGVVLVAGSAGLYKVWSHWPWAAPSAGLTPEAMVGRLARRLEKNPDDLNGWLRLGRSYSVLGQYPLAMRAYQKANQLADGKNAEALIGLGEALMANDGGNKLAGRAQELFERALQLEAQNPQALWYAGFLAYQTGRLQAARQHWAALVALDPPPKVKQLLEEKVAEIDQQLQKAR